MLELSFGHFAGVGPLWYSIGCLARKINNFFRLVMVLARRYCLNLNEGQPITVH